MQPVIQRSLDTSISDISIYRLEAYLPQLHIVNHISDTRIFLFFHLVIIHTYAYNERAYVCILSNISA